MTNFCALNSALLLPLKGQLIHSVISITLEPDNIPLEVVADTKQEFQTSAKVKNPPRKTFTRLKLSAEEEEISISAVQQRELLWKVTTVPAN